MINRLKLILLSSLFFACPPWGMAQDTYHTVSDLNFRSGPGTSYEAIAVIQQGDTVTLLNDPGNYWAKVEYQGEVGYVAMRFLERAVTVEEFASDGSEDDESFFSSFIVWGMIITLFFLFRRKRKKDKKKQIKAPLKTSPKQQMSMSSKKVRSYASYVKVGPPIEDVIDVNEVSLDLSISDDGDVPYWRHQYVYSYDEIAGATPKQRTFYNYLKAQVLQGQFVDIEGNTNYAFILYFDLLKAYDNHQDIELLDEQFKLIAEICPKTRSYSLASLKEKLAKRKDPKSKEKLDDLEDPRYLVDHKYIDWHPDLYKLGEQYRKLLNLSKTEVLWLNKIFYPRNKFNSIKGCELSIVKHYLLVLKQLNVKLKSQGETIEQVVSGLFEKACRLEPINFHPNYLEVEKKRKLGEFEEYLFQYIFKRVENVIRDQYGHIRKLNLDDFTPYPQTLDAITEQIFIPIDMQLEQLQSQITPPDRDTEIALNALNVSRWKSSFEVIKEEFNAQDMDSFKSSIKLLEELNTKNNNVESIFFESSKFIAKADHVLGLIYYLKYVNYNLSSGLKRKELPVGIKKVVLGSEEQQGAFDEIIANLEGTKDLKSAIAEVVEMLAPKKKKIVLDQSSIAETEKDHSGTVSLLSDYLNDTEEEGKSAEPTDPVGSEELESDRQVTGASPLMADLILNEVQMVLIQKIVDASYEVPQQEVEDYALSNGLMKNQLIDSINEACEDHLDGEMLIEEEEDSYIIEASYYEEILAK